MGDFQVKEETQIKYFSLIPHIIDDMNLSASAIRLYLHLKRVAGEDGTCWQSQSTLQTTCGMSNRTIVKAKRELRDKDLIKIELISVNGHPGHLITISNVWTKNLSVYNST